MSGLTTHHRETVLPVERFQQRVNGEPVLEIEKCRRLVENQKARLLSQRAREKTR
jgi:hypothetical protein